MSELATCPCCHKVTLAVKIVTGKCDKCFVKLMEQLMRMEYGAYR